MSVTRGFGAAAGSLAVHAALVALGALVLRHDHRAAAQIEPNAAEPAASIASVDDRFVGDSDRVGGGKERVIDVEPPSTPSGASTAAKAADATAEGASVAPPSTSAPASTSAPMSVAPPKPAPKPRPKRRTAASGAPPPSAAPVAGNGMGEASGGHAIGTAGAASTRDLGNAFTHTAPHAAQADARWSALADGDRETIEISIAVDEQGKLAKPEVLTKDPPKLMIALVDRTMAELSWGMSVFSMRDMKISSGKIVLKLTAVTSKSKSGAQGGDAEVAFDEYRAGKGKAHFVQTSGTRVDITVEVEAIKN